MSIQKSQRREPGSSAQNAVSVFAATQTLSTSLGRQHVLTFLSPKY